MSLIEESFLHSVTNSWNSYWTSSQGEASLDFLDLITGLLDRSDPIGLVVNDVDGLTDHLANLLLDVEASDELPEAVRQTVIRHIRRLISYLGRSQSCSTEDLVPVIEGAAGTILNDPALVENLKTSKAGKAVLSALVALTLFVPHSQTERSQELPPPDSKITVMVESNCHSVPSLGAGPQPLALEAGRDDLEEP